MPRRNSAKEAAAAIPPRCADIGRRQVKDPLQAPVIATQGLAEIRPKISRNIFLTNELLMLLRYHFDRNQDIYT